MHRIFTLNASLWRVTLVHVAADDDDDTASTSASVYGEIFASKSLVEAPRHGGTLGIPYWDVSV